MPLFRVQFDGPALPVPGSDELFNGAVWEGSRLGLAEQDRHTFLIEGASPDEAVEALKGPVEHLDGSLTVAEVSTPIGWTGLKAYVESVEWDEAIRCQFSELELALLETIMDDGEATWMVLKHLEDVAKFEVVETTFANLEQRGLVFHSRERSCNPQTGGTDYVSWWAISDHGWEVLRVIKRPWYNRRLSSTPDSPS